MAIKAVGLKTHIWNNQLRSIFLISAFPFLLMFMLWLYFYFTGFFYVDGGVSESQIAPLDYAMFQFSRTWYWAFIAACVWFSIAFFSHQKIINKSTGARSISRREAPELYNILENLCISRGITMPKLNIIESNQLNAFASGINQKTYTVTVTSGLLKKLNKDELRAVIAHELTHIMNKDVRLLIISIIFVGIFSFLAEMIGRSTLRRTHMSRHRSSKGQGMSILIAFVIILLGYLLAMLIRFSLSRKREFLADAGAVELTKDPQSMMSALEKISGHADIEEIPDDVKSMFIENPPAFMGLFATHPPIQKRIEVLKDFT